MKRVRINPRMIERMNDARRALRQKQAAEEDKLGTEEAERALLDPEFDEMESAL